MTEKIHKCFGLMIRKFATVKRNPELFHVMLKLGGMEIDLSSAKFDPREAVHREMGVLGRVKDQ